MKIPPNKKRYVTGAIVVSAAVAGLFGLSAMRQGAAAKGAPPLGVGPSARGGKAAKALAFAYAPNTTYAYALHYASKTKAVPLVGMPGASLDGSGDQSVEGNLELEGTLSIHAYPEAPRGDGDREADRDREHDADGTLLGLSLADCKGHFAVGGQAAWPADGCRQVFDGKELLVRVDRAGKVKSVHAAEGGASLFDYAMRALVEETQVRLSDVAGIEAWVEAEPLPQGTVESLYRIAATPAVAAAPRGEGDERVTIERTRQRYLTLSAASMLDGAAVSQKESALHRVVIAGGVIERIEGKETLEAKTDEKLLLASTTELELSARGRTADVRPRPDLSRYGKRALEDMPESRSLRDRMLEQRAAGLSWDDALVTIAEYGDGGAVPDHNRFLWRTTALLELEPKRAWDLVRVFDGGGSGGKLRGLVLDLLASASTKDAQAVIRQLLASARATSDPRYVHLVQRMGFVTAPDKESVAFVKSRFTAATAGKKKNERFAAAYAMGSMADRAKEDGDDASARALIAELSAALRDARPEELVLFLNALANTDSPSAIATFARYAGHTDPEVREAVADALDDPPTPEAMALLLDLARDPHRAVQRAALKSLRRYTLTAPVMLRLAQIAADGAFVPENVRFVVDLVKTYRFVLPREEETLLRALLAGRIDDDLVRAAVQQLLDAR